MLLAFLFSSFLIVLLSIAWIINAWRAAGFRTGAPSSYTEVCFNGGCCCCFRLNYDAVTKSSFREFIWERPDSGWGTLSMYFSPKPTDFDYLLPRSERAGQGALRVMIVPDWILMLIFAGYPAWFIIRKCRQGRRRQEGMCLSCGYDLRATPDRCPECGHLVKEKLISAEDKASA